MACWREIAQDGRQIVNVNVFPCNVSTKVQFDPALRALRAQLVKDTRKGVWEIFPMCCFHALLPILGYGPIRPSRPVELDGNGLPAQVTTAGSFASLFVPQLSTLFLAPKHRPSLTLRIPAQDPLYRCPLLFVTGSATEVLN